MNLTSLRKSRTARSGVFGPARLDRRTRSLAKRLRRGDVAVIDHVDLDAAAAQALVEAGVVAVVNLAPSVSGRYPSLGAKVLVEAGVVLLDDVGADAFAELSDGDDVRIDGDLLYRGDTLVAAGARQDAASVEAAMEAAKDGMADQLAALSANAVEHLRRERGLLLDGEGIPELRTSLEGRQVVVVLEAFDSRSDLAGLKTYIKENRPVLVGVGAGADTLLEAGHRPDLVVTDGDEASERALRCGAEVVARAGRDGRVRGAERLERLGVRHATLETSGTAEDAAILLAHGRSAALIVLAGSHGTLLEFLDRGRSAMASSFLTRAAVGSTLVDASAVARLYTHRVNGWWVALLVLIGIALVAAALATTTVGQSWWDQLAARLHDLVAEARRQAS